MDAHSPHATLRHEWSGAVPQQGPVQALVTSPPSHLRQLYVMSCARPYGANTRACGTGFNPCTPVIRAIGSGPEPRSSGAGKTLPPAISCLRRIRSGLCLNICSACVLAKKGEGRHPVGRLPISPRAAQIIIWRVAVQGRTGDLQSTMQVSLSRDEWATFTNSCLTR